jgi:hypothetical protein
LVEICDSGNANQQGRSCPTGREEVRSTIMRVRTLIAVGGLALAGLSMGMPAANAAEAGPRAAAEVPVWCTATPGATYFVASCFTTAPDTEYRTGINCTNSTWRFGPWRVQTTDLSNKSRVDCPTGGTVNQATVQFR